MANLLQPGDVVEVDGDASYAGGVVFGNSGTPSAPITVRGIPANGKRPTLSGGLNTIEAAGDHYVFEGLDITGGSSRCFYHHAHEITLRDSLVHDCPEHGVLGADSDSGSLYLEHSEIYRCGSGTQKHQIYIATDEEAHPGSVFRMDHCFVHDGNGGNNVKTRAERNEIRYNWIEGALYHELELIGPDGQDPSLAREDSDVVGNVLFKRNDFYVIRVGGDGTGETDGRYRFLNNTIIVQPGGSAVFRVFDGIEALEAHNNIFASTDGSAMTLLRDDDAAWSSGRILAGANNYASPGSLVPPEWSGNLAMSDPGFQDLASSDVRLAASSPLLDAGVATPASYPGYAFPDPLARPQYVPELRALSSSNDGLERPDDNAPDLGAYESGSSATGGGTGGASGSTGTGGSGGTDSPGTGGTVGSTGGTAGGALPSGSAGDSYDGTGGSGTSANGSKTDDLGANASPPGSGSQDGDYSEGEGIACAARGGAGAPGGVAITLLGAIAALMSRRRRNA